jgi:hypothetical protein
MEETKKAPAQETKVEEHRSRFDRRLEKRKKLFLDDLVFHFFEQRSALDDFEGQEAANLFDRFNNMWVKECLNFNKGRTPFKLIYEAFTKQVEAYIKMEKAQIAQTQAANKVKDFDHWLRRAHVWRTRPLTSVWYWLRALGNREKWTNRWKTYYTKCVTQKV